MTTLEELQLQYRETFDSDLELLDIDIHDDGESGTFINPDGKVYDFAICHDSKEAACILNKSQTSHYKDYALGFLTGNGYNLDSVTTPSDEAYGFLSGMLAAQRNDKMGGKCGKGWEEGPGGKCVRSKGGGKGKLAAGLLAAGTLGLAASTKEGRQGLKKAGASAGSGAANVIIGKRQKASGAANVLAGAVGAAGGRSVQAATGGKRGKDFTAMADQEFTRGTEDLGAGTTRELQGYGQLARGASQAVQAAGTSAKIQGGRAKSAIQSAGKNIREGAAKLEGQGRKKVEEIKQKIESKTKKKEEPKSSPAKKEERYRKAPKIGE